MTVVATLASSDVRDMARESTPIAVIPGGFEAGVAFGAALAVASLAAGYGLWRAHRWAWPLAVGALIAGLADIALTVAIVLVGPRSAADMPGGSLALFGGLAVSGFVYTALLVLLTRRATRAHLGRA